MLETVIVRLSLADLKLGVLLIPIALAVFAGCVSSQEPVEAARVPEAEDRVNDSQAETKRAVETKLGIIDMMEVLKRTEIGQPALAKWQREVEEQTGRGLVYRKPYNPYRALGAALASIMPKVKTVAQALAEKHDLAVVLQKGTSDTIIITLYNAPMYDLTEQVIEELNRGLP